MAPEGGELMHGRHEFRVRPSDPGRVRFQVELPGIEVCDPEVIDVGTEACTLRWNRGVAPRLPVGRGIQGRVSFEDPTLAFLVRLRPTGRVDGGDGTTYRFEIEVHETDRDGYLQALVSTFDRRATLRVTADPTTSIRAIISLEDGRGDARGRIKDLSEDGISLITDTCADEHLFAADILRVRVGLPTEPEPLELRARVLARQSVPGGLLYRLEFVHEPGSHVVERERLAQYVEARRREPLASV